MNKFSLLYVLLIIPCVRITWYSYTWQIKLVLNIFLGCNETEYILHLFRLWRKSIWENLNIFLNHIKLDFGWCIDSSHKTNKLALPHCIPTIFWKNGYIMRWRDPEEQNHGVCSWEHLNFLRYKQKVFDFILAKIISTGQNVWNVMMKKIYFC